jgi:hypothetical protein
MMDLIIGLAIGVNFGMLIHDAIEDEGLRPIQPCAMSMDEAHPEDELCTTWLDDQERVVFGPLWARPAQKGN